MGRLIFLGTGDPFNYERAQTILALPLAGGETMLVDTSSGTTVLRQLHDAGIPPESVRHIFISHRHFDHIGGLPPLLTSLVSLPDAGVTVYSLPTTVRAARRLLEVTIPGVEDWLGPRLRWQGVKAGEAITIDGIDVTPFRVQHGLECVGFRFAQDERVAVFTADTRPCPSTVKYARHAELLIHEVYALDDQAEQAHFFGHSTAADAGRAARAARVRRLILTHFRASAFVDLEALRAEAASQFDGSVDLACDLCETEF